MQDGYAGTRMRGVQCGRCSENVPIGTGTTVEKRRVIRKMRIACKLCAIFAFFEKIRKSYCIPILYNVE
jgi:hypothetical protein